MGPKNLLTTAGAMVLLVAAALPGCEREVLTDPIQGETAERLEQGAGGALYAANRYIVVLQSGVDPEAIRSQYGIADVRHVYTAALNGLAATLSPTQREALERDPRVAYVEPDAVVQAFPARPVEEFRPAKPGKGKGGGGSTQPAQVLPTGVDRVDADQSATARIDGNDERVDADVAVLDTGIDLNHPDLNVVAQYNATGKGKNADDKNGHGTHVAGTIAALDNGIGVVGVAPGARLWAVKVLGNDGSGFLSDVIAGVDYVTQNADTIEVANMSLGGPDSQALKDAIANSTAQGVVYVAAAGNNAEDASNTSPANSPDVLAVSAFADSDGQCGGLGNATAYGPDDSFASFSNYGPVVDIAAPGVEILSTYKDGGYAIGSGTSMAAPHVAGAVALYLATHPKPQNASEVAAVRDAVIAAGSPQSSECGFQGDPDSSPEPASNAKEF